MLDIHVVDVGGDQLFRDSRRHLAGLLGNLTLHPDRTTPGYATRTTAYQVARPLGRARIAKALSTPTGLLHVLAHGVGPGTLHGVGVLRRPVTLHLAAPETWPRGGLPALHADGVLLDACGTHTPEWMDVVAGLLPEGRACVVIAAVGDVPWADAAAYGGLFYARLLSGRRAPATPASRRRAYLAAHEHAADAFQALRGRRSPFRAAEIRGTGDGGPVLEAAPVTRSR